MVVLLVLVLLFRVLFGHGDVGFDRELERLLPLFILRWQEDSLGMERLSF